jgi:hypothetical protein
VNAAGLSLPAAAGVGEETVAFAAGLVDRSGKAPVIEAALARPAGRCPCGPCSPRWSAWRWMTGRCS